jgi:hypothetical protein
MSRQRRHHRAPTFAVAFLALLGMLGASLAAAPGAAANSFGGYTFSVGQGVLGERVSIRSPNSMVVASGNFVLYRAVLQVAGGGLIQTGIIQTASNFGLDSCGSTTSMRDYEETHAASSTQPYRCYYIGSHGSYVSKLFAVAKTAAQNVCTGCYTAFINGIARGPGQVSIAYGSNTASSAPNGSATGESVIYSTADNSTVTFGNISGVGGTPLQWTGVLYSSNSLHTVSASQTFCQNTDHHFNIERPYGASFWVHRSVASGPC